MNDTLKRVRASIMRIEAAIDVIGEYEGEDDAVEWLARANDDLHEIERRLIAAEQEGIQV